MTNSPVRNDVLSILTRNCRKMLGRADAAEKRHGKTKEIATIRLITAAALQLSYASHRTARKACAHVDHDCSAKETTKAVFLSCDLIDSAELMLANMHGGFSPAKADAAAPSANLLSFDDADDFQKEAIARRLITGNLAQAQTFLANGDHTFVADGALRFLQTFTVLAQEPHADIESVALKAFRSVTF